MKNRYLLDNVKWRRTGPRKGLLRRRGWQQRIWHVGEADTIEVAAALLANASLRWDEALYLYDRGAVMPGARVGARYGMEWVGP